jgi:uncharacterized protein (TIGR02147 family)
MQGEGGTRANEGAVAFRSVLRAELLQRCRVNPSYSLRAFARSLSCDASSLSKILHGKRPLGPRTIQRFGKTLGLGESAIGQYIYEEKVKGAGSYLSVPKEREFHQLSLDTFEIVSDWHHYAILELLHVRRFRPNVGWIARSLGLGARDVELAVSRLKRVGLLKITDKGKWIELNGDRLTTTGSPFTASAFRNMVS